MLPAMKDIISLGARDRVNNDNDTLTVRHLVKMAIPSEKEATPQGPVVRERWRRAARFAGHGNSIAFILANRRSLEQVVAEQLQFSFGLVSFRVATHGLRLTDGLHQRARCIWSTHVTH